MVIKTNWKRKLLFTKFAIYFFVFYDYVAFHGFHGFVALKPFSQAFEMNASHCSAAVAGADHWVEVVVGVVDDAIVVVQTDSTNHRRLVSNTTCLGWLFLNVSLRSIQLRLSPRLLYALLQVLNRLHIQPIQKRRRPNNFYPTIQSNISFTIAFDLFVQFYIIDVDNWILRSSSFWTYIGFISFGYIWPRTLTSLRLVVFSFNFHFWLRIVNISHT